MSAIRRSASRAARPPGCAIPSSPCLPLHRADHVFQKVGLENRTDHTDLRAGRRLRRLSHFNEFADRFQAELRWHALDGRRSVATQEAFEIRREQIGAVADQVFRPRLSVERQFHRTEAQYAPSGALEAHPEIEQEKLGRIVNVLVERLLHVRPAQDAEPRRDDGNGSQRLPDAAAGRNLRACPEDCRQSGR